MSRSQEINACYVCINLSCAEAGSQNLVKAFAERLEGSGVAVKTHICFGACWTGPNVVLYPEGTWYSSVELDDVDGIVEHIHGGEPLARRINNSDPDLHQLVLEILESMID